MQSEGQPEEAGLSSLVWACPALGLPSVPVRRFFSLQEPPFPLSTPRLLALHTAQHHWVLDVLHALPFLLPDPAEHPHSTPSLAQELQHWPGAPSSMLKCEKELVGGTGLWGSEVPRVGAWGAFVLGDPGPTALPAPTLSPPSTWGLKVCADLRLPGLSLLVTTLKGC